MRVVADLVNYDILQVEKSPELGEANPFNGKFAIPVPGGASVHVDSNSYILPQDGGDLASLAAQALLAQFPMYSHIVYNFLLESADILDLDLTATGPAGEITRAYVGRGVGPDPVGQAPNTTMVPPQNPYTAPARPGCLVTANVDITPYEPAGADEFLLWWHIWDFDTTDDVASDYGATLGDNTPSYRNITEVDQEPANWDVYISHDNGANWTGPVGRIEPIDMLTFNSDVRLCFINGSTGRRYLAAYAFLF